jgi:aminopeptidase
VNDPRIEQYAKLLVETCVDVQPGWQVLVGGSALARPLLEEVSRAVARRGAYALLRLNLSGSGINLPWANEAPAELLETPSEIDAYMWKHADALVSIEAPENTRELTGLPVERLTAIQAGLRPHLERVLSMDLKWVGCQYPTPALAQEAELSVDAFADFLYGACLLDWDVERERMQRYAERFDQADEVRLVAGDTDVRLSIAGRPTLVDAGGANMPGGEFFTSPVEDSAEGEIVFGEFPAVYSGRENTLFDEKIDGTVHLALGNGLPDVGGKNVSQLHWDIVKEMRNEGTRIELDGETVQESGRWLI